jgi:hypothetical protein
MGLAFPARIPRNSAKYKAGDPKKIPADAGPAMDEEQ